MTEFYAMPAWVLITLSVVSAVGITFQTGAVCCGFFALRPGGRLQARDVLELAVLAELFLLSVTASQLIVSFSCESAAPAGFARLRYIMSAVLTAAGAFRARESRSVRDMAPAAVSLLALPAADGLPGSLPCALYAFAAITFSLRGAALFRTRFAEMRTGPSALSVKQAVDRLPSGILFCAPDGYAVLRNRCMNRLMETIAGSVMQNGEEFCRIIRRGDVGAGCRKSELGGTPICRLPDGSVWMFRECRLRGYKLLSASDVTEQWALTERLRGQNAELEQRSLELSRAMENMNATCREEEELRIRSQIHDVLGQRITLLLRAMREKKQPDRGLLLDFASGLPALLRENSRRQPGEELDALRKMLGDVGISFTMEGELPEAPGPAALAVSVITEGVTNAVRHGYASRIDASCLGSGGVYSVEIRNSGRVPGSAVCEGGGLGGLRKKIEAAGGSLFVSAAPVFTVRAEIPAGINGEDSGEGMEI